MAISNSKRMMMVCLILAMFAVVSLGQKTVYSSLAEYTAKMLKEGPPLDTCRRLKVGDQDSKCCKDLKRMMDNLKSKRLVGRRLCNVLVYTGNPWQDTTDEHRKQFQLVEKVCGLELWRAETVCRNA